MITVSLAESAADRVCFAVDGPLEQPVQIVVRSGVVPLRPSGDAALVATLPLAMRRAEPLHVELPVSGRLRTALPTIQDVMAVWWPHDMARVPVTTAAGTGPPPGRRPAGVVGADLESAHLVLAPEAPEVLISLTGTDGGAGAGDAVTAVAGREVAPVTTNLAAVGAAYDLDWHARYRGAAAAAVAHLVDDLGQVDLPAPFSVHYLFAWGSHALLDPLWSGDALQVRHRHAERDWVQRLEVVAAAPGALASVRLCEREAGPPGCGSCRSCLLVTAALDTLGVGAPVDTEALAGVDLRHHTALADAAVLLRHAQDRPDVAAAVRTAIRRLGPGDVEWPENWFGYLAEMGTQRP